MTIKASTTEVHFYVEAGIPLPLPKFGRPHKGITCGRRPYSHYPWKRMYVGDSFLVPCSHGEKKKIFNTLSRARTFAQRAGKLFALRSVDGGIRVWRTQ
jgi:hypothetical protein